MLSRSDGTLSRGLVRIAQTRSNTDLKDPDANRGREIASAGYTQIPSTWEEKPAQKQALKLDVLGQFQAHNNSATYLRFREREQQQTPQDWSGAGALVPPPARVRHHRHRGANCLDNV